MTPRKSESEGEQVDLDKRMVVDMNEAKLKTLIPSPSAVPGKRNPATSEPISLQGIPEGLGLHVSLQAKTDAWYGTVRALFPDPAQKSSWSGLLSP